MRNLGTALCSRCEGVQLGLYFQEERHVIRRASGFLGPAQDATVLCSLAGLHATSGACALCGLIMQALCMRWGPEMWMTADEYIEWANNELGLEANSPIYLYSYLFAEPRYGGGSETSPPSSHQAEKTIRSAFRLGIALRGPSENNRPYLDHAGDIQLLSTNPFLDESWETFRGRIVDSVRANIQLAREWIDECEQRHGDLCETARRGGDVAYPRLVPRNLRVIDVDSMCLVLLPGGGKVHCAKLLLGSIDPAFYHGHVKPGGASSPWRHPNRMGKAPRRNSGCNRLCPRNWPAVPMGRCAVHSPGRRQGQRGADFPDGSGI